MAAPKPLLMPVETILHAKRMQCAAGSVHRAVISIACQFWAGGATLDGFDESVAQQIARIPAGHWAAIKSPVMAALGDILPELATRYATMYATREHFKAVLRVNGAKGRAIAMARRKARNEEANGKSNSGGRVALKTPQVAARHTNPRACMTPQELAALPADNVPDARFFDK